MAQKIPISITAIPVPVAVKAANINQLITLVTQYMEASISESVSFFVQGASDPSSDVGMFFNTSEERYKVWNTSLGKYIAISELHVGDIKSTFITGDDPSNGWIALDGRNVNNVTGITQAQKSNLETFFGANGVLPKYTFLSGLSGVPTNTSFSAITNPAVVPANNIIGALPINANYNYLEEQSLRDNTEQLRDSADSTQQAVASVIAQSEKILTALNAVTTNGPTIKIFVGYP